MIATREQIGNNATATRYKASGSLIAPNIVLTAAHTVEDIRDLTNLIVRAGDYDVSAAVEALPHQEVPVKQIIIHENFDRPSHRNNVALLVLDQPVKLTDNIGIVCLPPPNFDFFAQCLVAGWGRNGSDSSPPVTYQAVLKKASVNLVDHTTCQNRMRFTKLGNNFLLHDSFVCALGKNGEDTCKGKFEIDLHQLIKPQSFDEK